MTTTKPDTSKMTLAEKFQILGSAPEMPADETSELRRVDFSLLKRDDSTNVRTRYDADEADAMLLSVREHGILQNLICTELPDGHFKVEAGFRRHRALQALLFELIDDETPEGQELFAKRRLVPIRVLSAEEAKHVQEINLIENLQREAVDPVDEARGYKKLLSLTNEAGEKQYTYVTLAAMLGRAKKGPEYIRHRLNLLQAPDFLLDAMRDLGMSPRVAELVGKIPNKKDREEMAKRAIKHPHLGIPMTISQVSQMITEEFTVSLVGADWDLEDPEVLDDNQRKSLGFTECAGRANDGSCARCLFRTGNDPLLADDLRKAGTGSGSTAGIDPNLCQNPRCFGLKAEASWRAIERLAAGEGNRVMDKQQAKRLWENGAFQGPLSVGYIRKDYRPDYDCTGHFSAESQPTWGELLSGLKVSWILVRSPNKRGTVYLFEKPKAIELVEEKCRKDGKPNPFANRPGQKTGQTADAGMFNDLDEDEGHGEPGSIVRHHTAPSGSGADTGRAQANEARKQEAEKEERKLKMWRRVMMQAVEDKLRQKPEEAISADIWKPLFNWLVELTFATLNEDYVEALIGVEWPWNHPVAQKKAAVLGAYEADKTEHSQMRWAILLLLAGEMGDEEGLNDDPLKPSELCRHVCKAMDLDIGKIREQVEEACEPKKVEAAPAEPAAAAQEPSKPQAAGAFARGPGGNVSGTVDAEAWDMFDQPAYHCDCCGRVCHVDPAHVPEMERLPVFVCGACEGSTKLGGYALIPPLRKELQEGYDTWTPLGDGEAVKALKPDERQFLDGLLNGPVEATVPNKHGVFDHPFDLQLTFDEKTWIAVCLAVDEDGLWHPSCNYEWKDRSGGGLPNLNSRFDSRIGAVWSALVEVGVAAGRDAAHEAVRAKQPRETLGRLEPALREVLELRKGDD